MGFGFFKKTAFADLIIKGGTIYTMNPNFPTAEGVACKDGLIIAVGDADAIDDFEDGDTEIIDLEGGYALPGLINTYSHPVFDAFEKASLFLQQRRDLPAILKELEAYITAHSSMDSYFAFGYDEVVLKGLDAEETRKTLDEICEDKPVVILGESGIHCWVNTIAFNTVRQAAETDEVSSITLPYLLSVLTPLDFEAVQQSIVSLAAENCKRGITTVFDCGSPDFLDSVYQETLIIMYNEDLLKQRYFGSLLINRDVSTLSVMRKLAQKRTNCAELNGFINYNTLKLLVDRKTNGSNISEESLNGLVNDAADNGFDIHIDAVGRTAVFESLDAMKQARAFGYKKNCFTIAHDETFSAEEQEDNPFEDDINEISSTLRKDNPFGAIIDAQDAKTALELLTVDAAIQLGVDNKLGTIEKGKYADFAIYSKDPLEAKTAETLLNMTAIMTIVGGRVVFDAEEDDCSTWYELFKAVLDEE